MHAYRVRRAAKHAAQCALAPPSEGGFFRRAGAAFSSTLTVYGVLLGMPHSMSLRLAGRFWRRFKQINQKMKK